MLQTGQVTQGAEVPYSKKEEKKNEKKKQKPPVVLLDHQPVKALHQLNTKDMKVKVKGAAGRGRGGRWLGVSYLVGALSPASHKRLHQGWKQMSVHLLLILHKSHQTISF